MSNCSDNKNPLQHSGTSQAERLLPGLQAGYVQVNEKEYADWIVFAAAFASYLTHYDAGNSADGTWEPFFTSDISALLGTIAIQDIDSYRGQIKERFDFIKDDANSADINSVKKKLHELFSVLLSLSKALDNYYLKLPEKDAEEDNTIALKNTLKNCIETKLAPALQRLIAYHKGATVKLLLQPGDFTNWKVLNTPVQPAETIINGSGLSESWWRNGALSWNAYVTGIATDASIFGSDLWDEYHRINHAANHNLFASIFDQFTQNYTRIINEATAGLLTTLGNWNTHAPHYALFLAFLKLFRLAQADINTITQRHLDFYYKEVLQLLPKAAAPNKAHVLVELAKMTDDHALEQGALLKAGKDSAGKEVLYALDKETTFNKAKVAFLKSVYKSDKDGKDNHGAVDNVNRLFASPVTNSDDGLGAALTSPNKEWHPFINKQYAEAQLTGIAMPNAEIGFAIASHYLYCVEGERKIIIRLGAGSDNAKLYNKKFFCYLTTEKEWLAVETISPIAAGTMTNTTACAEFTISLPGDAAAITNYSAAVHGGTYGVSVPMLKMVLKNTDDEAYKYNELKDIKISEIEVKVEVGNMNAWSQTGLKQLMLSNDFGPIDASKPFQPFGPLPKRDNTFVIGNKEIFSKKNAAIKLNFEWAGISDFSPADIDFVSGGNNYPYTKLNFLAGGIWKKNTDDSSIPAQTNIFNSNNQSVVVFAPPQPVLGNSTVNYADAYDQYNTSSNAGFMRFILDGTFGHKEYQDALTEYLIEKARSGTGTSPKTPYTPLVKSLYVSYSANGIQVVNSANENTFNNREIQFFHIYPFGDAEQHSFITKSDVFLLPQFNHYDGTNTLDHIGEFYIGISNLHGQQAVNILFQVMEGTADPLVIKPDNHIQWSYLAANKWTSFDKNTISDATRQLVQSGIISFVIPADATTNNTTLPAGYLWLRAAVTEKAEAICKLLSVDAQAALVTFWPNNNADDFLEKDLPASTISKLKLPDAAVKKVVQPYTSFGGRPKEKEDKFYIRVSERLRHKNRAITIWDYEHLVLENFPQIYKAKCLNHTKLVPAATGDEMDYNEVAPGYVTVITIPNLQNRNDTNPLKPYTNQNTLLEIEAFLKTKISCHVNLGVRNPQFEEVRMQFDVKLLQGFDDFTFYKEKLQQEITSFLTPWAFASNADISFGGKIYKSVLIDFIEERPYVDFITNVQMFHRIDDETPESGDLDEITASTARSILVSAQASKHVINEITINDLEEETECSGLTANK